MTSVYFFASGPNKEMRCCAGPRQNYIHNNKSWYKEVGQGTERTYCEYCYKHGVIEGIKLEKFDSSRCRTISCDTMPTSYKDKWGSRIYPRNMTQNKEFGVSVHLTDQEYSETRETREAILATTHRHLAKQGVGVYEVPSGFGFMFKIYSMDQCADTYYSFVVKNGKGEKVMINKGSLIYYPGNNVTVVDNMESGTDRSFVMYVPSNKEKNNGVANVDPNNPENNWTFELIRYQKVDTRPPPPPQMDSYCSLGPTRGCSNSYNQGMTLSGGKYTADTSTVSVPEGVKYIEQEKVGLTIQLVSSETQEQLEHINKEYNTNVENNVEELLDEEQSRLIPLLEEVEKLQKSIENHEEQVKTARERLKCINSTPEKQPTQHKAKVSLEEQLEMQKLNLVAF